MSGGGAKEYRFSAIEGILRVQHAMVGTVILGIDHEIVFVLFIYMALVVSRIWVLYFFSEL